MTRSPKYLPGSRVSKRKGSSTRNNWCTASAKPGPRIDAAIVKYAPDWPLARMAAIERNVLRIALYEIIDMADIPTSVAINEAVDIAKRYGTEESGKFVNGILGAYVRGEHVDEAPSGQ